MINEKSEGPINLTNHWIKRLKKKKKKNGAKPLSEPMLEYR